MTLLPSKLNNGDISKYTFSYPKYVLSAGLKRTPLCQTRAHSRFCCCNYGGLYLQAQESKTEGLPGRAKPILCWLCSICLLLQTKSGFYHEAFGLRLNAFYTLIELISQRHDNAFLPEKHHLAGNDVHALLKLVGFPLTSGVSVKWNKFALRCSRSL